MRSNTIWVWKNSVGFASLLILPRSVVLNHPHQGVGAVGDPGVGPRHQPYNHRFRQTDIGIHLVCDGVSRQHHLEMLGRLICLCGGTPDFAGGRRQWWNGSFVSYRKDLCGALLLSLSDEVAAVEAYKKAACRIQDPKIQAVLQRIAMDEALHVQLLREEITGCGCPQRSASAGASCPPSARA